MKVVDADLIKRRQRELSKRQAIYVAARERGLSREASAVMAGYPAGQEAGKAVEKSENVQKELAKAREEMAQSTGITRDDVLKGLKDAAEMANTMADPQAMVRAWSEIGKMLGFYAPDKKVHLHELGKETQQALRQMKDEDLLRLAHGKVVEGTVLSKTEEPNGPDPDRGAESADPDV